MGRRTGSLPSSLITFPMSSCPQSSWSCAIFGAQDFCHHSSYVHSFFSISLRDFVIDIGGAIHTMSGRSSDGFAAVVYPDQRATLISTARSNNLLRVSKSFGLVRAGVAFVSFADVFTIIPLLPYGRPVLSLCYH